MQSKSEMKRLKIQMGKKKKFEHNLSKEKEWLKPYRFPVNRKDHTTKHPEGYLTSRLKRMLKKKFKIADPETEKIIKMTGSDGVMLRLVWNALQGENDAIKQILERLDGKVTDKIDMNVQEKRVTLIWDMTKKDGGDKTK